MHYWWTYLKNTTKTKQTNSIDLKYHKQSLRRTTKTTNFVITKFNTNQADLRPDQLNSPLWGIIHQGAPYVIQSWYTQHTTSEQKSIGWWLNPLDSRSNAVNNVDPNQDPDKRHSSSPPASQWYAWEMSIGRKTTTRTEPLGREYALSYQLHQSPAHVLRSIWSHASNMIGYNASIVCPTTEWQNTMPIERIWLISKCKT